MKTLLKKSVSVQQLTWIAILVLVLCIGGVNSVFAVGAESVFNDRNKSIGQFDEDVNNSDELLEMSLEELMEVPLTLVSKKDEKFFKAPAAAYVITDEDIRRSGHQSIPELLRLVPGIEVARLNGNKWAIASRGFNGLYSEKVLVMIDGRSVYTPLHSGVYWDVQDVMLEDIERIEVIRGPGGTLWGANAVNGIINIITKNARDTQGGLLVGGIGTEDKALSAFRYGGKLSDSVYYRVYTKYFDRDDSIYSDGSHAFDGEDTLRQGFRIDWDSSLSDHITFQGDFYAGHSGERTFLSSLSPPYMPIVNDSVNFSGQNLSFRWSRKISETSGMALQFYYDRTKRDTLAILETRDTYDVDFQHHFQCGDNHSLIWGLGYRHTGDNTDGSYTISLSPAIRDDQVFSAFIQDEIAIIKDKLEFIIGSKFEENDYTGFEYQPSARLLWTPDERNTIWASFTRAVSTPSRFYSDVVQNYLVINPAMVFSFSGSDDLKSQEVKSYELGYRLKSGDGLYFDITGFYNEYDHLFTLENNPTSFTRIYDNKMYGETYGGEISAHWMVKRDWKITAGYSFLQAHMHMQESSTNTAGDVRYERSSPHNTFRLISYFDLPNNLELNTALYYVDTVPYYNVPSYIRLDIGLSWQINKNTELSVVGQNLLDSSHPEFGNSSIAAAETQRAVFGKLVYRF
ncbi:MAG: TonB-dependent receptor [Phycisphaerales bacterium]|jgi:iron complex outermembrane receptor protein